MQPSPAPSNPGPACLSSATARVAKEDLKKILNAQGIQVALGIGFAPDGGYAIAVRITPAHGLSDDQIQMIKAIHSHNGVPLDVKVMGNITPRS